MGSADAKAMECTTGVRTAPMGAGWKWGPLADSACSHHIPSLAPAVALPAPRHDRRRTGAAGSPPGGFPFVELTSRVCEMRARVPDAAQRETKWSGCAADPGPPRTRTVPGLQRTTRCCAAPGTRTRTKGRSFAPFPGQWEPALLQDAALAGPPQAAFRAHSSVGRAADS